MTRFCILFKKYEERKNIKYYAIENSNLLGESTSFIEFMLEMILKSVKNSLKSDQKILVLMRENSKITIKELMEKLSMSESGIKKIIKKLKDEGRLERFESLKSGHWTVIKQT